MNIYTETIANGLKIDAEEATKVHNFMDEWFDDFRWSTATESKIVRKAKEAQKMMADPRFGNLVA